MYLGGFRPAEAVGLSEPDLTFPDSGWGTALLHRTRPSVGKQWTDPGQSHDDRGLKNRPTEDVRRVPVPPQFVSILRERVLVHLLLPGLAGSSAPGPAAGSRGYSPVSRTT